MNEMRPRLGGPRTLFYCPRKPTNDPCRKDTTCPTPYRLAQTNPSNRLQDRCGTMNSRKTGERLNRTWETRSSTRSCGAISKST
jgi:hypothetical protein